MEAVLDAAKQVQEFESRYQANEAGFRQIEQQFRQMQEGNGQMQSLAEERLAAMSSLNVELKARHSQGEQTLAEVRALVDGLKAQLHQRGADRSAELAQTLGVLQALVEKLQERQSQMEQSLVTIEALAREQEKHWAEQQAALGGVRAVAEKTAEWQAQAEMTLGMLQATQQAEKGLIAHFEKSLNTVRSMVVEMEQRQAKVELGMVSIKATGSDATMINQQTVGAVAGLMKDIGDRQSAMTTMIEEARQLATQALERSMAAPGTAPAGTGPPSTLPAPEVQAQAAAQFQQFLAQCESQHQAAVERENELLAHWRQTLDKLPSHAEASAQKCLEQSNARLDQLWSQWLQTHDGQMADAEKRQQGFVDKVVEQHQLLEQQVTKLASGAQPHIASAEWIESVQAASAAQSSELRFLKTLLWITLAAVGISYVLVAYAVVLRSS